MSTKVEKRSSFHDLIDDIIEAPSSSSFNSTFSRFKDGLKSFQSRNQSAVSSSSSSFDKSKYDEIDHLMTKVKDDLRNRGTMTLNYSNSLTNSITNEERRKEIDFIIKNLSDGKISTINDDRTISDGSDQSLHLLSRAPITTTTTSIMKNDETRKNSIGQIDFVPYDGDILTLQRELQEKELDIIHLHKEIQELQLENKLLKANVVSPAYSNGYASNNSEVDVLHREKDILQNELHVSQELVAKLQQQQYQNVVVNRSNKIDETALQQKETFEKKLRNYEKLMRTLTDENDRLKQNLQQLERTTTQYKKEKEELQNKVNESKKRNDELFHQEFNTLKNDLQMFKQRNNELFEENIRLLQEKRCLHWDSSNQEQQQQLQQQQQQQQQQKIQSSLSKKLPTSVDPKYLKINRSESPNMSEASDSTNYLATVSIERYHPRLPTGICRSIRIDGNSYARTKRYSSLLLHEDLKRYNYLSPSLNSLDQSFNFRSSKDQHSAEWSDETIQNTNEDKIQYGDEISSVDNVKPSLSLTYKSDYFVHRNPSFKGFQQNGQQSTSHHTVNHVDDRRQNRKHSESIITKRPFAPSSINDIHVHDLIKFTRPGGKISKGLVKYIGTLPGKNDQYLGLELEDEETKHDGVYQDKRLFQCKPNKGIFIAFNKVIMAWSGT